MDICDAAIDPVAKAHIRIAAVISDPACSYWLKDALSRALDRDPVDAVNDAEALCDLLDLRTSAMFDKLLFDPLPTATHPS